MMQFSQLSPHFTPLEFNIFLIACSQTPSANVILFVLDLLDDAMPVSDPLTLV
jgi:hypothetical protein